ncbi:RNA polymerase sigma factor [Bailinhaonella thermotolerans]|uniref:RNA polymerase sigma factor n=1 Tax=Bailinhaonella thermotolerans TaxID=1070861 RepID=A0A3A4AZX7_9ACTN|nr:RNA polymerase sigma factor [Bailinhaonella thermotolerans]RJL27198.1 RNA polymerase sigma factor [Bailinhaonella thermotolerans]
MPRTAVVSSPARENDPPALNELLDRGRAQGHLSLSELREVFATAQVTPAQGRSILRELTEAGVRLAEDETRKSASESVSKPKRTRAVKGASAAKTATKTAARTATRDAAAGAAETAVAEPDAEAAGTAVKPGRKAGKATAEKTTAKKTAAKKATAKKSASPEDEEFDAEDFDDSDLEALAGTPAGGPQDDEDAEPTALDLDDQSSVMGDSVHTYLKSIGRRTLLTAEQEVDLAKRIEAGLYAEHKLETEPDLPAHYREELEWVAEDGRRAKDHMLEANLRLVVSVAKKYTDRGMALLDVVQEGNLGLIRSVEKFDYTKGFKFSTYAMWWIRQAIQRGFADSARTIRLPVHVLEMLSKLSRIEREMHQRLGREPTPEELAVELDKTPDQIEELLRTSRQPISLDSTIGEDGETSIGDLIEDVDSPEASEVVDRQLLADQLRSVLGNLSPREAKIVALRFGLVDGKPHTLDEIGKHLGLTRERIRQLEKESLSKLRHPSNTRPLLDWAS